jgi:hypothetical protein
MHLCRLCGRPEKLVKAHIIPEAFFRPLRQEGKPPLLVSGTQGQFPKRAPIGIYDETILCEACEARFAQLDHYGVEILQIRLNELFRPVLHLGETVAYQAEGIDQKRLLRFLIATLWRASVSDHSYYKRVTLGPYEDLAKQVVLATDDGVPKIFGAVLSRWDDKDPQGLHAKGLMDPFRERWNGVNAYRFYFGHVVAYIKVSNQGFTDPLRSISLLSQPLVTMIPRNFKASSDFAAMLHTAKLSQRNME